MHIEGIISYNGEPVEGAMVTFQPLAPEGEGGSGLTDSSGRFTVLSSRAVGRQSGIRPGEYRVLVSKLIPPPPDPDEGAFLRGEISSDEFERRQSRRGASGGAIFINELPEKYSDPRTSGLQITVNDRRNEPFNFNLTDD